MSMTLRPPSPTHDASGVSQCSNLAVPRRPIDRTGGLTNCFCWNKLTSLALSLLLLFFSLFIIVHLLLDAPVELVLPSFVDLTRLKRVVSIDLYVARSGYTPGQAIVVLVWMDTLAIVLGALVLSLPVHLVGCPTSILFRLRRSQGQIEGNDEKTDGPGTTNSTGNWGGICPRSSLSATHLGHETGRAQRC